jgi:hypothetical protein
MESFYENQSAKGSERLTKRLKKHAERYQKKGIMTFEDAVRYEENKLFALLNKKTLS